MNKAIAIESQAVYVPKSQSKMKKNKAVTEYLSKIGRKGGQKSKRMLTPEQAREMVRAREAKKKK